MLIRYFIVHETETSTRGKPQTLLYEENTTTPVIPRVDDYVLLSAEGEVRRVLRVFHYLKEKRIEIVVSR